MALPELDYMEYANDATAQAAYPSSDPDVEIVGQSQIDSDGTDRLGESAAHGGYGYIAQSFKLTNPKVSAISFYFTTKVGAPAGDVYVKIETDSGGHPSGILAHASATKTITWADLAENAWNKVTFASSFELSINTTYWVVWTHDLADPDDNYFNVGREGGDDNYADGHSEQKIEATGVWANTGLDWKFRIYVLVDSLQCYSESTIKQQGSYSLKGIARQTESLNDTLTRTIVSPIDLSGINTITFDIYASRTGANIKLGIHDSGGTTTEKTHTISTADTWETASWDISGVADADKDVIDSIIITATNADADNTFYIDNFIAAVTLSVSVSDALSLAESIGGKGGDLPSSVSDAVTLAESIKLNLIPLIGVTDAISIAESIVATLPNALESSVTDTISIAETIEAVVSGCIMSVTDSVDIGEAVSAVLHLNNLSISDAISIAESVSLWFPYYDVYSLDLYIDQVRSLDLFVKTTKTLDMYIDQVKSFTMEH